MQNSDVENRLSALEHFVLRLYLMDCLQSADPLQRLQGHQKFAEALNEEYTLRSLKTDDETERMNAIGVSFFVSEMIEQIDSVVQANAK